MKESTWVETSQSKKPTPTAACWQARGPRWESSQELLLRTFRLTSRALHHWQRRDTGRDYLTPARHPIPRLRFQPHTSLGLCRVLTTGKQDSPPGPCPLRLLSTDSPIKANWLCRDHCPWSCITAHLYYTTLHWVPPPTRWQQDTVTFPHSPEPLALLSSSGKSQLCPSTSPSHSRISYPSFRMGPFQSPMVVPEYILCPPPPPAACVPGLVSCREEGPSSRPSSRLCLLPWTLFSFLGSSPAPLTTVVLPLYLLVALGAVPTQQRAILNLTEWCWCINQHILFQHTKTEQTTTFHIWNLSF